jgi:hypothetical protein
VTSLPPRRRPLARGLRAALLVSCLVLIGAAPRADASPDVLRRSFGNMIGGPLDMALSPFTGILTLSRNLEEIEDSTAVRVTYALPGWIWLTGLNFFSGGIRTVTGGLEVLPGIVLFPFETDIEPLFDPVEDAGALIELDNPLTWIENPWVYRNPLVVPFAIVPKWGIDYTRPEL